jgi:hypothetical protein
MRDYVLTGDATLLEAYGEALASSATFAALPDEVAILRMTGEPPAMDGITILPRGPDDPGFSGEPEPDVTSALVSANIHIAYFEAALAEMGYLNAVNAAIAQQSAVKQRLWARATTISTSDPDVVAIADALDIDLSQVAAKAAAIQAGERD